MNNFSIEDWIAFYIAHTQYQLILVDQYKRPVTQHGLKDATRVAASLQLLASRNLNANLAVVCGHVSNIFVVDIDNKSGKGISGEESLHQRYGEDFIFDYGNCFWTSTPSGGKHLYFQCDDESNTKSAIRVLENVDIKYTNGYVLLPGSQVIRSDGSMGLYTGHNMIGPVSKALPWTIDLLQLSQSSRQQANTTADYKNAIAGFKQGSRENSIFRLAWGMRKEAIHIDVAKAFIKVVAERCEPPFPKSEAVSKVLRAYSIPFKKSEMR